METLHTGDSCLRWDKGDSGRSHQNTQMTQFETHKLLISGLFYLFPFNSFELWLTKGNWNCKKRNVR